jgi:DNA-binding response OmpR family regulator
MFNGRLSNACARSFCCNRKSWKDLKEEAAVDRIRIGLVAAGNELWGVENTRKALSAAGYKVLAVENWEAIDILARNRPALVIASLTGSRESDISLCKLLARGVAPLVVISSPVEESQQLAFFEAGATDFLTHPVNLRELIARVNNILYRTQPPLLISGTAAASGSASSPNRYPNGRNAFSRIIQVISKHFNRLLQ